VDLSIVIIEYFCTDELQLCLENLKDNIHGFTYEVLIASNSAYPEEKQDLLKKDFPKVHWIFNQENLGFAKAINQGVLASHGEVILTVNVDVKLTESIDKAYHYLTEHASVGILGPKIIDQKGNLQDSCRYFMTPSRFFSRLLQRVLFRREVLIDPHFDYTITQPVDWIIGAFMMFPKATIDSVGLLDERYFFYVEDMDWCKRFWQAGYEVIYFPELTVQYKGDRKSLVPLRGEAKMFQYAFYHLRSYFLFLRKYFRAGLKKRALL